LTLRTASTASGSRAGLFLRAERRPDGRWTFRPLEGEPLPTSYGPESYRRIFGTGSELAAAIAADGD
jgi:hypothetical protein